MVEPIFRCGTLKAIQELSQELQLRHDRNMQDWSYEVSKAEDIERYFTHYEQEQDGDKKFVLMEMLIQATNDQPTGYQFDMCWRRLKPILWEEFELHAYTIYYWGVFDNENLDDCWTIAPYMRELWFKKYYQKQPHKLSSYELANILGNELVRCDLVEEGKLKEIVKTIENTINVRKSIGDY